MKSLKYLLVALCLLTSSLTSGQLSPPSLKDSVEVSVLTCGPGDLLYSLFGHTAIRVENYSTGQDLVYNYGTFDFQADGFAIKFLRGKLPYQLSVARMSSFLREYQMDKRYVKQQSLNLSNKEKFEVIAFLYDNLRPENRFYKYDFYYDNCTTRIRDLLEDRIGSLQYPSLNEEKYTFRDLLHQYLTQHPWTKFGMDIILGTQSDQVADYRGQMFLPEYFFDYLDTSTLNDRKIIGENDSILSFPPNQSSQFWFSPFSLFMVLLIFECIGFFLFYISGDHGYLKWYDRLWYTLLTLSSIVFLFMWFGTDHTVCKNNWNLLWAGPWTIFSLIGKEKLAKISFWLTIVSAIILLLGWNFIPQQLNTAILPLLLIQIFKALRHLKIRRWIDRIRYKRPLATIFLCCLLSTFYAQEKIGGVTLVSPPRSYTSDPMIELTKVNANWVALVPYGFSRKGEAEVRFGSKRQWWGERVEGIVKSIEFAKANQLKIMLKPQVWIPGGWVGEMDFETEEEWKIWEQTYESYIMTFVELAIEYEVEMICVGTEYRMSVVKRERYWRELIRKIRKKYNGLLTYSSNWDSYSQVPFWDALDHVGISAYFPLSDLETPPILLLTYRWNKYVKKLRRFSKRMGKSVLFTEYGYLSVDGAAGKTWELEKVVRDLSINEKAQANGYEALLKTWYNEDFWAGGFLWKWFPDGHGHEGYPERDYTPQNKIAEEVLSEWYGKISNQK